MGSLVQDLRYGMRTLRKNRGFALIAVLTLALGIGANSAIFSVIDAVVLSPLPYPQPDRLFALYEEDLRGQPRRASYPTFEDWREQSEVFSGIAFVRGEDVVIRGAEGALRLAGGFVSPEFFGIIGTRPVLGRVIAPGETGEGGHPLVLSYALWQQRFGGDPEVLGQTLSGPEGSYTIVGVMPRTSYPAWADVWLPISARPAADPFFTQRDLHVDSHIVARLREGVTLAQAQAQMNAVATRLSAAYPDFAGEYTRVRLTPLREELLGDVAPRLLILGATVVLVLLIACVNVANLMLARAMSRTRELAVRAALGAGRWRIVRQLLAESVVLAVVGGAAGVLLALGGLHLVTSMAPAALPRLDEVVVNGRVLLFTLGLALFAAILFGLLPALRAASPNLVPALKSGTAGTGVDRQGTRLRSTLVVGQVALTLVLLIGASLLIRSFWQLQQERLGFDPEQVAAVRIFPPSPRYDDPAAAAELYRRLEETAAAVPSVQSAAVSNHVPMTFASMPTRVMVPGREAAQGDGEGELALYRTVSPDYFSALRIPLLRGRLFAQPDLASGGGIVVDEAFVRAFLPEGDPRGQTVTIHKAAQGRPDFGEPITAQVIGVVGDVRQFGLDTPPPPTVYLPYTWNPWGNTFLLARTAGDPRQVIPALRRAVLGIDPDLPIAGPGFYTDFHLMSDYLGQRLQERRLHTALLGGFAGTALALALIGIFGVLAYVVAQRTREIGLRLALGAGRGEVLRLIVGQAMWIVVLGLVLGTAGALAVTRLLESSLYGVTATDPLAFGAAALLFAAPALLASLIPARRATRVDPMVALRHE